LALSAALKGHGIAWNHLDAVFASSFVYSNATKSLKYIAKRYAFLQPHYKQARSTNPYAMLDPSTEQNFDEAIKCKDKEALVMQAVQFTLPFDAPDVESSLRQISEILTECPPKSYKYVLTVTFNGLDLGGQTLPELPITYIEGRQEFMPGMDQANVEGFGKQFCTKLQLGDSGTNLSIVAHCLLKETSPTADLAKMEIPVKFSDCINTLNEFKPKEIKRTAIYSVAELKQRKEVSLQQLSERTAIPVDEIKEQRKDYYNNLALDQLVSLEQRLHQHIFGTPYTERTVADDADERQKRYYIAMIFNDINRKGQGRDKEIQQLRIAAAKAIQSNSFVSFDALETSNPVQEKLNDYVGQLNSQLAAVKEAALDSMLLLARGRRLPHDLESLYTALSGIEREKFDRKKILTNEFKPLGYQAVKQDVGSVGLYEFEKQLSENELVRCIFDFGTWRQTVSGHFTYRGGHRAVVTLPFIYWSAAYPHGEMKEMDITTEKLFAMAFENIAYLANMLEKEHVPKFRAAFEAARLD